VIRLSDSFSSTIADLAGELSAGLRTWDRQTEEVVPAGTSAVLVLAGGAESDALDRLRAIATVDLPKYLIGASADHRIAATAIQLGATDYLALPQDLDLLRRLLDRERREAEGKQSAARFSEEERRTAGFDALVGESPVLKKVVEQGRRVAQHRDVTVLIGGETGTGKELLARALHYHSPRAAAPFVEINCAAIPAQLLESELFGHEKGAFTGAVGAKPGLMELAHGGTVFLDEVGALPFDLQPKLLRALETRQIRRVGGQLSRQVDIRLVGATHVDLRAAVTRGEFREDLFYRLNVVSLVLPPLRERGSDITLLAETFVRQLAVRHHLPLPAVTPELASALQAYHWPGNVRELRNAIERAMVLSPPGTVEAKELPRQRVLIAAGDATLPFPAPLRAITLAAVQAMLERTGNNKSAAARQLGISRPRLQRILDGSSDDD
jgi:DNA-binding NtrC family response regulator